MSASTDSLCNNNNNATEPLALAPSAQGRVSGKSWKLKNAATRRSRLADGVKTERWEHRMAKTKQQSVMKRLEGELKEKKQDEINRRKEIAIQRKKAAEERQRLDEANAKMGARRAARLRRKEGRTKKINH